MSENVWHSKRTAKQQNLPLLTKCYSMALSIICYHKLSHAFCICSYPIFNNSSLYIFGILSNLILITSHFLNTSNICQKIDTYQALRIHGSDINILHLLNTHKNRPPEFCVEKRHRRFHRCQIVIKNVCKAMIIVCRFK